jgi:hypothetical protein
MLSLETLPCAATHILARTYNQLRVKPVDGNKASVYQNPESAAAPEYFGPYVVGGPMGGRGIEWYRSIQRLCRVDHSSQHDGPRKIRGATAPLPADLR